MKVGESWKTSEVDTVKQSGLDIIVNMEITNTFSGVETIDGVECSKIISKIAGMLEGSGSQMGAEVYFEGDTDGTSTWYFTFKEGRLLKSETEMLMEGTATVSGAQNMTIPITQETKVSLKSVK